jgi:hypothetical protein
VKRSGNVRDLRYKAVDALCDGDMLGVTIVLAMLVLMGGRVLALAAPVIASFGGLAFGPCGAAYARMDGW